MSIHSWEIMYDEDSYENETSQTNVDFITLSNANEHDQLQSEISEVCITSCIFWNF